MGYRSHQGYIKTLVWYILGPTVKSHLVGDHTKLQKILFLLNLVQGLFLSRSDTCQSQICSVSSSTPEDYPIIYLEAQYFLHD